MRTKACCSACTWSRLLTMNILEQVSFKTCVLRCAKQAALTSILQQARDDLVGAGKQSLPSATAECVFAGTSIVGYHSKQV